VLAGDVNRAHWALARPRMLLIALSLAYLLMYLPFLDQVPPIVVDEPWYANTAHNLAIGQGLINTNVGQFGGDQLFLYPLVVSIAFKLGGTGLWVARLTSFLLGLLALWGWIFLCRELGACDRTIALTGGLFVTSNVYFVLFRRARPEALVIVLSVWALFWFIRAWRGQRFNAGLVCALLVGGSALAHPNGVLLAGILFVVLSVATFFAPSGVRQHIYGYVLGGIGVVLFFLIGWELLRMQSIQEFLKEVTIDSGRLSVTQAGVLSALWSNLATFVPAYSLGLKRVYILLFEVGVLFVGLLRFRADRLAGLLSLIGLAWFTAALALLTPFVRSAFCIVIIFSLAVTARQLSFRGSTGPHPIRVAAWLLTLLYGLNNVAGDLYLLKQNAGNTSYTQLSKAVDASVPDGVPVLTHLELWFAFQNNPVYTPFTRFASTPFTGLSGALKSGQLQYAVLSSGFSRGLSPTTGEPYSLFVNPNDAFYKEARAFLTVHGRLAAVLPTRGYGDIEIWEFANVNRNR
jgi:hypothetical protein